MLALKLEIAKQYGLPFDNQQVTYHGRLLTDEEYLSCRYLSSITVSLAMQGYFIATYRNNKYRAVEYISGLELVAGLRRRLAELLGLEVRTIGVNYNGRELSGAVSLASAGVQEGSLLKVFLRDMEQF